jgi:hypothetical protein
MIDRIAGMLLLLACAMALGALIILLAVMHWQAWHTPGLGGWIEVFLATLLTLVLTGCGLRAFSDILLSRDLL